MTGNPSNPSPSSTGAPVSFPSNPGASVEDTLKTGADSLAPEETKWFFKEAYAKLSVKGNFMPLAAKPSYLDLGDWLAHQSEYAHDRELRTAADPGHTLAVEQYRLITYFIVAVQEVNQNTNTVVCNANECPTMSAGRLVIASHQPYRSQRGS